MELTVVYHGDTARRTLDIKPWSQGLVFSQPGGSLLKAKYHLRTVASQFPRTVVLITHTKGRRLMTEFRTHDVRYTYDRSQKIGEGTFGEVVKGRAKWRNGFESDVAVKLIHKDKEKAAKHEIGAAKRLKNHNYTHVMKIHDVGPTTDDHTCIVMPRADLDLRQAIEMSNGVAMDIEQSLRVILDVAV